MLIIIFVSLASFVLGRYYERIEWNKLMQYPTTVFWATVNNNHDTNSRFTEDEVEQLRRLSGY